MSNRVLDAVDNVLSDPSRWTKQRAAEDIWGRTVSWKADSAVCFCLTGALERAAYITGATYAEHSSAVHKLATAVKKFGDYGGIVGYNDRSTTTFPDIKAVIAYAKAM